MLNLKKCSEQELEEWLEKLSYTIQARKEVLKNLLPIDILGKITANMKAQIEEAERKERAVYEEIERRKIP